MTPTLPPPSSLKKRGQTFELLLVIGVLIVLIQGFVTLSQKNTSHTGLGMVGDTALSLSAIPAVTDGIHHYLHSAALLSLEETMTELGRRGFAGATQPCGIIAGYTVWNTADQPLTTCMPAFEQGFSEIFLEALSKHLAPYLLGNGKTIEIPTQFDLGFRQAPSGIHVTGTTPDLYRIPLTNDQGDLVSVIGFYPSFAIPSPDLQQEWHLLQQGARDLLSACSASLQPFACSKDRVYTFNTQPGALLNWKAGPCAGDIAADDPRIVSFCVQAPRNALTKRAGTIAFYPMLYRFALTMTPAAQLTILSFQANNIPTSARPTDKGGLGLAPGSPIHYTGSLTSPDLDKTTLSLCFGGATTTCQPLPKTQWITTRFATERIITIEGTIQPLLPPPFTLTLIAEHNGITDTTAGIDVVKMV